MEHIFLNLNNKKLTRKEKIFFVLKKLTEDAVAAQDNQEKMGFDAECIGSKVLISRNNTSKELNELIREGKIIKIKGKPVLYLDKDVIEKAFNIKFNNSVMNSYDLFIHRINDTKEKVTSESNYKFKLTKEEERTESVINSLIGFNDSLKVCIEQAKAAVMYPPKGLNTLIVGPTGVGKSTFAEVMYKYAIEINRLDSKAPFIIFNCADYMDNPQLLLSQLFGHVKGAFTGAEKDRFGLVSQANGGILFLDEVHRLPPEGQEMLFMLMDKGIYRRLGESNNVNKSSVLIITATTEDPKKVMLDTFLRRIPVVIKIPSLSERTLMERMELIYSFFKEEAYRINVNIKVSKEVIKALMLYECKGNIGQLRSDIQLICAKAFLDYMTYKTKFVEVKLSQLSNDVRQGLFEIQDKREALVNDFNLLGNDNVIFENNNKGIDKQLIIDINKNNTDFYNIMESTWETLHDKGFSESMIREEIEKQIEGYSEKILKRFQGELNDEKIWATVVNSSIVNIIKKAFSTLEEAQKKIFNDKIILCIALHIQNMIERVKMGNLVHHPDMENVKNEYKHEYKLAKLIIDNLSDNSIIDIPEDEVAFLATFLYLISVKKNSKRIGILVIMHGESTASSMAQVANELLGINHAHSINMSLNDSIENILDRAIEKVKEIDYGKGVLLLADMGSILTFPKIITERTGIPTMALQMTSTPVVIEATRKSFASEMTLEELYEYFLDSNFINIYNKGYSNEMLNICDKERYFDRVLIDTIRKTLTFLNPEKAYSILKKTIYQICDRFMVKVNEDILVKFIFHCACMIERVILNQPLPYKKLEEVKSQKTKIFNILRENFINVEQTFGIQIPDVEIANILDVFETQYDTLII